MADRHVDAERGLLDAPRDRGSGRARPDGARVYDRPPPAGGPVRRRERAARAPNRHRPSSPTPRSGKASRWRKVADGGPRGRYAHAMAFDDRAAASCCSMAARPPTAERRSTTCGSGTASAGPKSRSTGPTPGHRYQPVMVYDRARGRTVLYGGIGRARRHVGVGRSTLAAEPAVTPCRWGQAVNREFRLRPRKLRQFTIHGLTPPAASPHDRPDPTRC